MFVVIYVPFAPFRAPDLQDPVLAACRHARPVQAPIRRVDLGGDQDTTIDSYNVLCVCILYI